MTNEDWSASLADAVADGRPLDWAEQRRTSDSADPELLRSFQVIASISEARRAVVKYERERSDRMPAALSTVVAAIAGGRLFAALLSAAAGWSEVPLGRLRWPFSVNVLVFGISGTVLVIGGARDRRVRSLGVLLLIIASAFADPLLPSGALMSPVRHLHADAFLAFALWWFVWLFPSVATQPQARVVGQAFLALSAGLGLLLFVANAILGPRYWNALADSLRLLNRNAATLLYWPILFVVAAPAIMFLLWKSRVETTANRRRIAWFVMSLVFGLTPMLLAVILTPLVPPLRNPEWQRRIGILLYVMLASIVPSTAYAVIVSHVMDVHLVIRRTIQYGLARSSVWGAIIGPLVFLAFDLREHRLLTVDEYLSGGRPVAALTLSTLSLLVLTFRHRILAILDLWFDRQAADHGEALARLERGFRMTRTVRDVAGVLTRELRQAVHCTSTAVLIVDAYGQLLPLDNDVPPLARGSALLELLRSVRTETQVSYRADGALARLLPRGDLQWLTETRFGLFSPLIGSGGALLGLVGIGEAKNGLPYTERDNMLITAMTGQAALKLENSLLRDRSAGAAMPGLLTVDWDNEPGMRCPECGSMWVATRTHCSCGTATIEAALPLVVKGKFRVDHFIGAGGTGVVYHAVDMALDRQVAIKTLPAIRLEHSSRLYREARAMANVMHPNLALIYGAERWKGMPLLIFEYLDGGTLLDSLRSGPLALDEAIGLGTLLADALDRVHRAGVLHRDIKPSNIGYTSGGVPKLLDFGLAAILDRSRDMRRKPAVLPNDVARIEELTWGLHPTQSLTLTQQLIGTPLYLSPEALAGREPEPSFDLWSLSMVMYEAVAGCHPLAADTIIEVVTNIQQRAIPDVRDFRPDCPRMFAEFLNDALSPLPERRPATAAALRTRLRSLHDTLFPLAV